MSHTWTPFGELTNIGDITKRASEAISHIHLFKSFALSELLSKIHPFPARTKRGQVVRGIHCNYVQLPGSGVICEC